jgi:hypothetical protein
MPKIKAANLESYMDAILSTDPAENMSNMNVVGTICAGYVKAGPITGSTVTGTNFKYSTISGGALTATTVTGSDFLYSTISGGAFTGTNGIVTSITGTATGTFNTISATNIFLGSGSITSGSSNTYGITNYALGSGTITEAVHTVGMRLPSAGIATGVGSPMSAVAGSIAICGTCLYICTGAGWNKIDITGAA